MAEEKEEAYLQKVKDLVELMKENNLIEVEIINGADKILLKRPAPALPTVTQIPMAQVPMAVPVGQLQTPMADEEEDNLVEIKSPMVGTFYSAPSPDSEPYASVGLKVNVDTVVCMIEAMKVMNEIKAETTGTIVKILCEAGQAIEYGQVLFKVKPH